MTAANPVAPAITNPYDFDDLGVVEDPLTGRLSVGGREIGDTGCRNVASSGFSFDAAWTTITAATVRRMGPMVELVLNLNGTGVGAGQAIGTVPLGFRPSLDIAYHQESQGNDIYISPAGECRLNGTAASQNVRLYLTYMTGTAWPSTLPGVSA